MRELSIEQKAQRYDEAIERAESIYNEAAIPSATTKGICTYIFPELKESEDERIRKALIKYYSFDKDGGSHALDNITPKQIVTWLEKQGEQKPDTNCLLGWSEMDEKMLKSLEGIVKDYWAKAEQEKNEIKIREASNVSYFLKTIQKSPLCWIKCSDGLPNRDGIYLVVTDGLYNEVYDMARYDSIEGWHKASEVIYWMPIPQLNNKSIIENSSWSEEDEETLKDIITSMTNLKDSATSDALRWIYDSKINWLESLKGRYTWKPSDEQMGVIEAVINNRSFQRRHLDSLYADLKKLREE